MFTHVLTLCAGLAISAGEATETPATPATSATATAKGATPNAVKPAATAKGATPNAVKPAATAKTPAKATVKPASFAYHKVELDVLAQTNAERARYGLPALTLDPNLVSTARRHASWMTRNHTLQHGSYPVAENIAMGQRSSGEVLRSWMNSSGHRANILNGGHRRIGVAAYTTANGTIYWCQQFTR